MKTLCAISLLTCSAVAADETNEYAIAPPTADQLERYRLDEAFYRKCCRVQGIFIATSQNVSDLAIKEAAYQFDQVMRRINADIAVRIRERNVLCVLVGHDEFTSDVPQFQTDKTGKDLDFYNWRQRGFLTHRKGQPIVLFA